MLQATPEVAREVTGLRLERLGPDHDLSAFRSGQDALGRWLHDHALTTQQMDPARTFVLTQHEDVLGYFSQTMGSVLRSDAPRRLVRGLPAHPVAVALLARLAVDIGHHRGGLGGLLLAEALRKAVAAGDAVAACLVVVDASDEAAVGFHAHHAHRAHHAHHGFLAVPEHPMRLYRRIKDIRASLNAQADSPG